MQIRTDCVTRNTDILLEADEIDLWEVNFRTESGEEEYHGWITFRCPLCDTVEAGRELNVNEGRIVAESVPPERREIFDFAIISD